MKTSSLCLAGVLVAALAPAALGQQAALQGVLGNKALLMVDGAAPKLVAAGESHRGVKLVQAAGDAATVEIEGKQVRLRVGDAPASVGAKAVGGGGRRLVLAIGSGGHAMSPGKINGREVSFMVDTGATLVALAVADAERIGLNYKSGQLIQASTANGMSQAWRVRLASVRIGDVEVADVDAAVMPQAMPFVLLGNSFLSRFKMQRDGDQMTLERRY